MQHVRIPTMTCGHRVRTVSVTSTVPMATLSAAIADAGDANTPLA